MIGKRFCFIAILVIGLILALLLSNKRFLRMLKGEVLISFVGDIMLSRDVGEIIAKEGTDYPYSSVKEIFRNDDLTIGNLECPLTTSERQVLKNRRYIFKVAPGNAEALKRAGFDILSLANNHIMDYQADGLTDTVNALSAVNIAYIGAVRGNESNEPLFVTENGVKLGFLGYNCFPPEGFFHRDGDATIMYARDEFMEDVVEEIKEASALCDLLTVYYHWGVEYSVSSSEAQRNIAYAAIDAGANIIIGDHPHVLQESEKYKDGVIYYSLGNFIFDRQIPPDTDKSVILQMTVTKAGIKDILEIPITISDGRPEPGL